jgi:ribonuclease-3
MTRRRAAMVNSASLARMAERVGIGPALLLGRGVELSGGRRQRSILANAFEAVMGAFYLDRGYGPVRKAFIGLIGDASEFQDANHKGHLQEEAQTRLGITPAYSIVAVKGPGHDRLFTARVSLADTFAVEGSGPTKQEAEQEAARVALEGLRASGWEIQAP